MTSEASKQLFSHAWSTNAGEALGWQRLPSDRREAGPKVRILVIDENFRAIPNLVLLLQEDGFVLDLKSHMNFTVVTEEMFDDYQAVIVDVMIPCSGGFELLRAIRKSTCVPVLVLTALGDEENRVVGLELGADDYVVKPCRPREVVARMHALLRRPLRAQY
jgi:DNA-binding response OmpR family regulator